MSKLIVVTGTREADNSHRLFVEQVISSFCPDGNFCNNRGVEGGARGIDNIAQRFFKNNDFLSLTFEADWDKYGRWKAGPLRNEEMRDYALEKRRLGCEVHVVAFPLCPKYGPSKGTRGMMRICKQAGLEVHEFLIFTGGEMMNSGYLKDVATSTPLRLDFKEVSPLNDNHSERHQVKLADKPIWIGEVFKLKGSEGWLYSPMEDQYIGLWRDKYEAAKALVYALGVTREKEEKRHNAGTD